MALHFLSLLTSCLIPSLFNYSLKHMSLSLTYTHNFYSQSFKYTNLGAFAVSLPLVKAYYSWDHNYKSFLSGSLPWFPLLQDSNSTSCVLIVVFLTLNCRLFTHLDPSPSPQTESSVKWRVITVALLAHSTILYIETIHIYWKKDISFQWQKQQIYKFCWLLTFFPNAWNLRAQRNF